MKKMLLISSVWNDPVNVSLKQEFSQHGYETAEVKGPRQIKEHLEKMPYHVVWRLADYNFELASDIAYLLDLVNPERLVVVRDGMSYAEKLMHQLKSPFKAVSSPEHCDVIMAAFASLAEGGHTPKKVDEADEIDFIHLFKKNREDGTDQEPQSPPKQKQMLKYPDIGVNHEEKRQLNSLGKDSKDNFTKKVPAQRSWLKSLINRIKGE